MAMQFAQAGRAQTPDLLNATIEQGRIAAALRQAKQQARAGNVSAASQFGQMVPEGAWGNLGEAVMGGGQAGAEAGMLNGAEAVMADAGMMAEMGGASTAELGALAAESGLPAVAEGAAASAGAGGAGGVTSALGALGPWGWATLAALAATGMQ